MNSVKHTFHIDAPFARVFDSLSTISGLAGWWTSDTSGSTKVGDTIQFKFGPHGSMNMKVNTCKVNELIEWECVDKDLDWEGTIIQFKLSANDNKVRIEFVHSGFKNDYANIANINFSWGRYLVSLRNLCEKGIGEPFAFVE